MSITPAGTLAQGETYTVEMVFDEQVHAAREEPWISVLGETETPLPIEVEGARVRFQLTVPETEMVQVRVVRCGEL